MGLSSRLLFVASLVFALFALWQARVEYLNYSSVLSTIPINGFDPSVLYEIASITTPTRQATTAPLPTSTLRGERTAFRLPIVTPMLTHVPSPSPIPPTPSNPTPSKSPTPPTPSPTAQPTEGISFTIEPRNATWRDTVTISWKVSSEASGVSLIYRKPTIGSFAFMGGGDGWYELPTEGTRTVSLQELFGTGCQTPTVEWELTAYQADGDFLQEKLTSTISYADVPLALSSVSLSPHPAPAYAPVSMTWVGTGGSTFNWYGHSGIDEFGVDAGKHWRELRLTGSSGTASWVLYQHTARTEYGYRYGAPGLPSICGTVSLEMSCPYAYWFDEPAERMAESCPTSLPVTIPAAYQRFEHGVMVWDSGLKEIHILYDDGSNFNSEDYWLGGDITYPETPPFGMYLPQRGFGSVWVNNPAIQEKLGWATAPEQSYITTRQEVKNGRGDYLSGYEIYGPVYFTMPDGRAVRVYGQDGWRYME